jgi:hypothetical protein
MDECSTEKPATTEEKPRQKRWVLFLVSFLAVAAISLFLWWFFRQKSYGSVSVAPTAPEPIDYAAPEHRKEYRGKYITFSYPSDFTRREENESVKYPLLERIYLSKSDIEGRKIALTVQDNTGYSFDEYSSFRIRRAEPSVYHEEKIEKNGLKSVLFTKNSVVFEVSAFFYSDNQVASITVSSPTTLSGLQEEVSALLDSFRWQD